MTTSQQTETKKVYVVSHQNYMYECDCMVNDEIKRVMTENFTVEGVFRTEKLAKQFIKNDSLRIYSDGEDDRFAKHEEEYHYFIEQFEIDGVKK